MSQDFAPNAPRNNVQIIDTKTGFLTGAGLELFTHIWRQVAAGFTVTPCQATGTNAVVLTPIMHEEGGSALADYMPFSFELPATLSGLMTIKVADNIAYKAYTSLGRAQATTGDFTAGDFLVAYFVQSLDSAVGGFVCK